MRNIERSQQFDIVKKENLPMEVLPLDVTMEISMTIRSVRVVGWH